MNALLRSRGSPSCARRCARRSIATTGYILIGIALKERDLIAQHGGRSRGYREQVDMLLPRPSRRSRDQTRTEEG